MLKRYANVFFIKWKKLWSDQDEKLVFVDGIECNYQVQWKKCWVDQDEKLVIVEIINYICNDANVLFDLNAKKLGLSKMKSCW